jgi:hypothetical protein
MGVLEGFRKGSRRVPPPLTMRLRRKVGHVTPLKGSRRVSKGFEKGSRRVLKPFRKGFQTVP